MWTPLNGLTGCVKSKLLEGWLDQQVFAAKSLRESLQRIDGAGIIARMIQLRCFAWQKYSVPSPIHNDTNHKLIRY
jgi:hypothetical protein